MKTQSISKSVLAIAISLLISGRSGLFADGGREASDGDKLVYLPPPQSANEQTRVIGAASRGIAQNLPVPMILSPEHTGWTIEEQPSLFWFVSQPATVKLIVTLSRDDRAEPTLERTFDTAQQGIQRLDLAKEHVKLEAGVVYRYSVALRPDAQDPSKDVPSSGCIERIKPPNSLIAKMLSVPRPRDRAVIFAHNHIFYDALTSISEEIESHPEMHKDRAELLEQVGLPDAAAYDRGLAAKAGNAPKE